MESAERFTGCMVGGAVGDALGYLIEDMDLKTIHKKYGPYGLRTILKLASNDKKSVVSDDTQMALFTADGLLWAAHDQLVPEDGVYRSYMRWYYTQTERLVRVEQAEWIKKQPHEEEWGYDMMGTPFLFTRRSPGKVCLMSLASGKQYDNAHKPNTNKSSTVMRTGPVGLFYAGDPEKALQAGCRAGQLTHGGPSAYLSAGVFSALVSQLIVGEALGTALTTVLPILQKEEGGTAMVKTIVKAIDEAVSDHNPVKAMSVLGLGWNADEALALAVYCLLKNHSLKDAVLMACNQDGDSDTCGAVCGTLGGAVYGKQAIPKNWLNGLDCLELTETLAQCLYQHYQQSAAQ